ncbi:MAG: hypothetical protein SOW18_04805 [Peptoniphilus sp.]|nr:hypothetical protein [Peptoniphilus sp.]MDY3118843.1 hypothetical protein [Peptoniphilus sp.]
MKKQSFDERKKNAAHGLKKSAEVEEAVRRFKSRESKRVLPLLGKKASAAALAHILRRRSGGRRPMYLARRVQRARLAGSRRFLTEEDLSRAIRATGFRLRSLRRGDRRGR